MRREIHPLRRWSLEHGVSLAQVAKSLGVSRDLVSKWTRDVRQPSADQVERMRKMTDGQVGPEAWKRSSDNRIAGGKDGSTE
jgi:transcriptional regulator with XRE-family HTH domain